VSFPRVSFPWIAVTVLFLAAIVLLREILVPFLVGMAVAYLLSPLVSRLERAGVGRGIAAFGIVSLFYLAAIILMLVLTPLLVDEIASFVEHFPNYLSKLAELATDPHRPWLRKLISEALEEARQSTGELTTLSTNFGSRLLRILWSDGQALLSTLSLLVIAPIVAIYLLADWEQILAMLDRIVPASQQKTARAIGSEVNEIVKIFLQGQGVICLVLAAYYAIGLKIVGVNHAYSIGIFSGLVSFAPYLGLITGLVLSLSVALLQFWPNWMPLLEILSVFICGQAIADYVLSPRLIGDRLKLNPVLILFAVAAFGYLFGFVGLLVAVPAAAAIGVVVRVFLEEGLFVTPESATGPAARTAGASLKKGRWF
jgi:predicted PurR-regulated permease PerM